MKMNKSTRRSRRHRNAQQTEGKEQQPFFSKNNDTPVQKKEDSAFFQPKLTIGEPNEKYEQEADSVADAVVNQSSDTPAVQSKEITSIQRYMTNAKEDEMGTNTERIEKDKAIQEKPEVQKMEDEEPVQMMEEEESLQAKEEEEPVQMQEEKEESIQKMEEEEPVQMMEEEESLQAKEEEEPVQMQEEEEALQAKSNGAKNTASPQVAKQLNASKGGGSALSDQTNQEMSQAIGYDFSGVKVHTNREAEQMNQELGAQAFTHESDVYFNAGKYSPGSKEGKRLLAHELTHVVQQGDKSNAPNVQKDDNPWPINGRVINNFSTAVMVWSDASGCYKIAAGSSSNRRGEDVDFVQRPFDGRWFKIGPFTVTVTGTGMVMNYLRAANSGELAFLNC